MDFGLHGIPFESLERVGDFMARVENLPQVKTHYAAKPLIGEPYVLITVPGDTPSDKYTLIAEVGDEVKTNGPNVWIRKKRDADQQ